MTSDSHAPAVPRQEGPKWAVFLRIPEVWGSLAIIVMWLAVLFDAVYGPSFVSTNGEGSTTIPSAIFVALFAFLATASVAKRAFGKDKQ